MKYLKSFFIGFLLFVLTFVKPEELIWLPFLLGKMNEKQMKSLGIKISANNIYSINKGSVKDVIVSFAGNSTREVISSKGLVLANHHRGFDPLRDHSILENNYIKDGFWATSNAEEPTKPKLFVNEWNQYIYE